MLTHRSVDYSRAPQRASESSFGCWEYDSTLGSEVEQEKGLAGPRQLWGSEEFVAGGRA